MCYCVLSMKGGNLKWAFLIILAVLYCMLLGFLISRGFYEIPNYDIVTCNGGYQVGDSCKLEPTGCEYADSLPTDLCDKAKPEPLQPIVVNWNLPK